MTRKLKVGFALIAVFATSAVAVSGAQAEYVLTPAVSPALLTGEAVGSAFNGFEITSKGTRVQCGSESGYSTVKGQEVTEGTLVPSFSKCTANGELSVTIQTNGCTYTLTGETNGAGRGIIHLVCPTGKQIEVTIPGISCTVAVHAQTPTDGGFTGTNVEEKGKPDEIRSNVDIVGITYERIGTTAGCVAAVPKEGNDADITGNATIRAYEDLEGKEGEQVNLTVS
jgi:hypothetical protein